MRMLSFEAAPVLANINKIQYHITGTQRRCVVRPADMPREGICGISLGQKSNVILVLKHYFKRGKWHKRDEVSGIVHRYRLTMMIILVYFTAVAWEERKEKKIYLNLNLLSDRKTPSAKSYDLYTNRPNQLSRFEVE